MREPAGRQILLDRIRQDVEEELIGEKISRFAAEGRLEARRLHPIHWPTLSPSASSSGANCRSYRRHLPTELP